MLPVAVDLLMMSPLLLPVSLVLVVGVDGGGGSVGECIDGIKYSKMRSK